MFTSVIIMLVGVLLSAPNTKPTEQGKPTDDESRYSISVFVGYGQSAFEKNEGTWTGDGGTRSYVPLGIDFLYQASSAIAIGTEFDFTAMPFYYEEDYNEVDVNMWLNFVGLTSRIRLNQGSTGEIYAKLAGGVYSGTVEVEDFYDFDLEEGFGMNLGLGYIFRPSSNNANLSLGLEGIYHITSLTAEEASQSTGYNHWALRVLVGLDL